MTAWREYRPEDRPAVEAWIGDPPGVQLYLRSRLDEPAEGRGFVYGPGSAPAGFAWFGRGQNLAFAGEDPEFLDALSRLAVRHETEWLMVVGPLAPTTGFLERYLRLSRRRPRLDRVQALYRMTPGSLGPLSEPGLRPTEPADLPDVTAAAVRMSAEDFEIDPWRIDREGVRRTMARKIADGRAFVYRERDRFAFKVDLAVRGPAGAQVEGVFTTEEFRGRGIASRCMAELGRRLLPEVPWLCLHVAERNAPARRAYEKAGFRHEADLRLAIIE